MVGQPRSWTFQLIFPACNKLSCPVRMSASTWSVRMQTLHAKLWQPMHITTWHEPGQESAVNVANWIFVFLNSMDLRSAFSAQCPFDVLGFSNLNFTVWVVRCCLNSTPLHESHY